MADSFPSTLSEVGRLTRVVLKHVRQAFAGPETIAAEWKALNFSAPPDYARAIGEYDRFVELIASIGAQIDWLPASAGAGLDSVYVRDASVVSPSGMILGRMGKPQREPEPHAQGQAFDEWGMPARGTIQTPGLLEGGDLVWLDNRTVIVGRGYRTNDEGIRQMRALVGPAVELVVVPLPHWRGAADVFHLMSIISPVDQDLAVVYSPLLPVPFRELLLERAFRFVEVPDSEFDSMGANVLALSPRRCVMVAGNSITRARLEDAGAEVLVYEGHEISLKGGGGPTCLTRPISRSEPS
ncbi:MAG TPA: arginine deiminase family protein [Vicinamibacterales bacterium]|nr:arginine deiminase family protein [Vicinamibacterales bacterium]